MHHRYNQTGNYKRRHVRSREARISGSILLRVSQNHWVIRTPEADKHVLLKHPEANAIVKAEKIADYIKGAGFDTPKIDDSVARAFFTEDELLSVEDFLDCVPTDQLPSLDEVHLPYFRIKVSPSYWIIGSKYLDFYTIADNHRFVVTEEEFEAYKDEVGYKMMDDKRAREFFTPKQLLSAKDFGRWYQLFSFTAFFGVVISYNVPKKSFCCQVKDRISRWFKRSSQS